MTRMVVGSTIINDKIHITYSSPQKDAETVILYYIIYIYIYVLVGLSFSIFFGYYNNHQLYNADYNHNHQLSLSIIIIHYCNQLLPLL